MTVLVLNAGLAGRSGNCQVVADHAGELLQRRGVAHEPFVLGERTTPELRAALARAERLVLVSGTYWGGFSSSLQRVLEELTPTETSELWLGKPTAVFVTAHQVGAQSVLHRLQGVLVTFGCLLPPLSGVVITKVAEALRERAPELCEDVWGLADIEVALDNLLAVAYTPGPFRRWPVDREHYTERWLSDAAIEHDG